MEKRDFKRPKVKKETIHRSLIYDARQLTNGGKKAIIKLDNQEYTLRITKNAKLILTK
ncbi:MAG: hemin uptake protein HemP [Paracoccaceae bacterium]|uniref:hemin uptake protein HemP n=1 Tax=Candidatus Salinivivens marinus TaxID=3381703 RepID=UPI0038859BB5|tara:strand:- start:574 stop:747 length:174 start_codon:yes stop_codon:yes gene_type:complete